MSTATYVVAGMTCEHCVRSVTEEVSEVAGVTQVDVDLASGALVVTTTLERLIGPNLTTVDRYLLSADHRTLTMERTFEAGGQPSPVKGRLVFVRR